LLPQIASLFGIEVAPGVSAPRPLRPTRPVRVKPKTTPAKPAATATAVADAEVAAPVASEPVSPTSAE
jgi:hypothetical protein